VAWPSASGEIPDEQPRFQIAYLPLGFAGLSAKERDAAALDLVEKCGTNPRKYRNGSALAIPATEQAESLRREVRYLIAVERVGKAGKKHNLTKEQADELRERKATHASAVESAFGKLYPEVWLPKQEQGVIVFEKIAIGLVQKTTSGGYKLVGTEELKGWVDAKKEMLIIDTMPYEDSYKKEHVPGAKQFLFPIPDMKTWDPKETAGKTEQDFVQLLGPDKNKLMVIYCGFVKCTRSHNGAMWAVKNGYTNVYRHPGGIFAWKGAKYPTAEVK
jgi:rhodanese-related sulfurtransferase